MGLITASMLVLLINKNGESSSYNIDFTDYQSCIATQDFLIKQNKSSWEKELTLYRTKCFSFSNEKEVSIKEITK